LPSSVDLSPTSTVTGICDLLAVASKMFRESDCQHTEDFNAVSDFLNKKTVLSQENRAMPHLFFPV